MINTFVILQIRKLRLRETDTIAYPLNRDLSSGLVIHLPNNLDLISNTIITVLPQMTAENQCEDILGQMSLNTTNATCTHYSQHLKIRTKFGYVFTNWHETCLIF